MRVLVQRQRGNSSYDAGNRIDQDGSDYLLRHNSSYMDIDNDPTEQALTNLSGLSIA